RGVDNDQVARSADLRRLERLRVRSLEHEDARVGAQRVRELPVADVDRRDGSCAALEEAVGEPTGRGAEIEASLAARADPEGIERTRELHAAAGDVGVVFSTYPDRRVFREKRTGLVDPHLADVDLARQNERLRARSRGRELTRDEELIRSHLQAGLL